MAGKVNGVLVGAAVVVVVVGAAVVAYFAAGKRAEGPGEGSGESGEVAKEATMTAASSGGVGKFTVSVATTGIIGPLRVDGTVDYVAAANARLGAGVTPESNAFTRWLDVMGTGGRMLSPKTAVQIVAMCGATAGEGAASMYYGEFLKRHGIEGGGGGCDAG